MTHGPIEVVMKSYETTKRHNSSDSQTLVPNETTSFSGCLKYMLRLNGASQKKQLITVGRQGQGPGTW